MRIEGCSVIDFDLARRKGHVASQDGRLWRFPSTCFFSGSPSRFPFEGEAVTVVLDAAGDLQAVWSEVHKHEDMAPKAVMTPKPAAKPAPEISTEMRYNYGRLITALARDIYAHDAHHPGPDTAFRRAEAFYAELERRQKLGLSPTN